jgi:hypothetical protein
LIHLLLITALRLRLIDRCTHAFSEALVAV